MVTAAALFYVCSHARMTEGIALNRCKAFDNTLLSTGTTFPQAEKELNLRQTDRRMALNECIARAHAVFPSSLLRAVSCKAYIIRPL